MKEKTEGISILDTATNPKEAEYDLVSSLLKATEFKTSDDYVVETKIIRNGEFLFSLHIHPLSEADVRVARKKATVMVPNPNNKKLPKIEGDFKLEEFYSWIIYLGTTEADQQKIWGNAQVMAKFGLNFPYESIDCMLLAGDKRRISRLIFNISGLDENGDPKEDDSIDPETFRPDAD